MSLSGLGVLLIGIGAVIAAVMIGRFLLKLSRLVQSLDETVVRLPRQAEGIMMQTGSLIMQSNEAIADLNGKVGELTPYFQLVGDIGRETEPLAKTLEEKSIKLGLKTNELDPNTEKQLFKNGYGSLLLGYFLVKKGKELKRVQEGVRQT